MCPGTAFVVLESTAGFKIEGLGVMTDFGAAFSILASMHGPLALEHMPRLANMGTSFQNARTIQGGFNLRNVDGLATLGTSFSRLTRTWATVEIRNNAALQTLGTAFGALTSMAPVSNEGYADVDICKSTPLPLPNGTA